MIHKDVLNKIYDDFFYKELSWNRDLSLDFKSVGYEYFISGVSVCKKMCWEFIEGKETSFGYADHFENLFNEENQEIRNHPFLKRCFTLGVHTFKEHINKVMDTETV